MSTFKGVGMNPLNGKKKCRLLLIILVKIVSSFDVIGKNCSYLRKFYNYSHVLYVEALETRLET